MRTIKFRGKNKTGEWVYGHHVQHPNGMAFIVRYASSGSPEWHEVDRDTVGEFTGYEDCNGLEIYEGDILQTNYYNNFMGRQYNPCKIEMVIGCWQCIVSSAAGCILHSALEGHFPKVIGNIYDNPGLMKGGEE